MGVNRFDRYVQDRGPQQQRSRFDSFAQQQDNGPGALGSFLSGGADALTFGFGDEIEGMILGRQAMEEARRRQELARANHGGWFMGGQLAGALAGSMGVGGLARGAMGATRLAALASRVSPAGRILGAGLAGGAGSSLYAAGDSQGDQRGVNAANAFIPGAVTGGAFQGLGEVASPVFRNIRLALSPEARSGRMAAEALERFSPAGANPATLEADTLQALRDAPDNATLGDTLPGWTQMVKGAGVRPSRMREELRAAYDADNNRMGERASADMWQTLNGTGRQDAADAMLNLRSIQETHARPLYAKAYQQRIDPEQARAATAEIIRRHPAIFQKAERHAEAMMLAELGTKVTDPSDPRYWHYLLQGAERELGARLKAGRMGQLTGFHGSEAALYTRAVQTFNTQVRRLLGADFRAAQDVYSGAARSQEAVLRGYDAVLPNINSLDLGELTQWMRRARPGEIEHMRLGALNKLSDLLESADPRTGRADVIRAITRNAGQRRVLERIFGGGERFNKLMARLDKQREIFQRRVEAGIGVNSHTADRTAAYETQRALTNPGGLKEWIANVLLRESGDKFDEAVSNQILETAAINANQAAGEISQVGGFRNWAGGRGLLSRALEERKRMLRHRPDALVNALTTGLYTPIGGGAAVQYGTGGY